MDGKGWMEFFCSFAPFLEDELNACMFFGWLIVFMYGDDFPMLTNRKLVF